MTHERRIYAWRAHSTEKARDTTLDDEKGACVSGHVQEAKV